MSDTTRKFTFDTEFGTDGTVTRKNDTWRKTIPRDEVQGMVDQAREEGRQQAETEQSMALQQACSHLSGQLQTILDQTRDLSELARKDAAEFSLVVARKIAGAALDRFEQDQLQDIVRRTLSELKGNPAIQINVSSQAAGPLGEALKDLLESSEYGGSVRVYGDTEAPTGSISLEWQEGMVSFNPEEVAGRVETEVQNWLNGMHMEADHSQVQEQGHG